MNRELEREFYIFGEPVETELGTFRFLSYKECLTYGSDMRVISMNTLHFYHHYRDMSKGQNLDELEEFKQLDLYDIVMTSEDIRMSYIKILNEIMNDKESIVEVFKDKGTFHYYRNLFMDMNMLQEDEVNPNPEIQKGIEISRKLRSEGEKQTPTDIITSIVAGTPNTFADVCNMTMLQVYSIFLRIGAFKSYDTSTLFATVSAEAKIESWAKNINLYEKQTSAINKQDFDKTYGSLLK